MGKFNQFEVFFNALGVAYLDLTRVFPQTKRVKVLQAKLRAVASEAGELMLSHGGTPHPLTEDEAFYLTHVIKGSPIGLIPVRVEQALAQQASTTYQKAVPDYAERLEILSREED